MTAPKLPAAAVAFIKSAETKTSPEKSRTDLEALLGRYGARSFGYARELGEGGFPRIVVSFALPLDLGGNQLVPVEIPIDVARVYARLWAQAGPRTDSATVRARAERVAWRHLYLFVDASLAAVALGLATLEEAFFAHTLVRTQEGQVGRASDFIAKLRETGKLAALPAITGGAQ